MRKRLASVAALAAVAVLVPVAASDAAQNDGSPNDPRAKAFVKEVSVDRVERHQQRLQEIATANGGTRDVFGTGYTASVDYVVRRARERGLQPARSRRSTSRSGRRRSCRCSTRSRRRRRPTGPAPTTQSDTPDVDFISIAELADGVARQRAGRSGGRDPRSRARAARRAAATAADYPAAVAGAVALIQRGHVRRSSTKWSSRRRRARSGVIIFNEGNTPARQNALFVDDSAAGRHGIPAVISSFAVGKELYDAAQAGHEPDGRPQYVRQADRPRSSTR